MLLHNLMTIHPNHFVPLVIALLVYLNNSVSYPINSLTKSNYNIHYMKT
jgi:hypothetical protein